MAFLNKLMGTFINPLMKVSGSVLKDRVLTPVSSQIVAKRSKLYYTDWRMLRDVKRRKVVKEYAKLRLQINSIRYNTVLPDQIKEIAQKEIEALPTDSCFTKLHPRCVLTSRARGRWREFRMSRIIWRHLADYNQLSGVERAMW
ncbi:small ribosomal subunit protein uS14m [Parasteatoda tepidariorum]|uniref:small ribosomal subunit protein uS14m n=1 Tax=Parasteatoda tepidariorum TaxID=114398 RepID=UPI00077FA87E|nr:28S ribosomal protein S14, mitochondrial [Parasteatoda tepidariorum]